MSAEAAAARPRPDPMAIHLEEGPAMDRVICHLPRICEALCRAGLMSSAAEMPMAQIIKSLALSDAENTYVVIRPRPVKWVCCLYIRGSHIRDDAGTVFLHPGGKVVDKWGQFPV